MSETMMALRWWSRKDVHIDTIPVPTEISDGWVMIEIEACGICGTDVEEYLNGPIVVPITEHPLTGAKAPLTFGHESVGVIRESHGARMDSARWSARAGVRSRSWSYRTVSMRGSSD